MTHIVQTPQATSMKHFIAERIALIDNLFIYHMLRFLEHQTMLGEVAKRFDGEPVFLGIFHKHTVYGI